MNVSDATVQISVIVYPIRDESRYSDLETGTSLGSQSRDANE